jgi:hypothetical protein
MEDLTHAVLQHSTPCHRRCRYEEPGNNTLYRAKGDTSPFDEGVDEAVQYGYLPWISCLVTVCLKILLTLSTMARGFLLIVNDSQNT